jgi:GNAT superfamily N-acetyltransferase
MVPAIELRVRFEVDDEALSELHRRAFGLAGRVDRPWAERLSRYSLTWVGAFDRESLVGFVNVCGDGGSHAFILDTAVDPGSQLRGIGRALVESATAEATRAGCEWLHVDFEPQLRPFYEACGFSTTEAGLLRLPH